MARKTLSNTAYTQINTVDNNYLIQNISSDVIHVIVSDTQPAADAPHTYVLYHKDGISSADIVGIIWGKGTKFDTCVVGYEEGL